jgi:hypothetical protein
MGSSLVVETVTTLVGIFIGTLAALAVDRLNERRRNRQRARVILRSLAQELGENYNTLRAVKPAYEKTTFGKSCYVSTIAWETAMSSGDLPAIIGFELTDVISSQYALLVRIRYYVDLLTQLWFAPTEIDGYEAIRRGFNQAIVAAMHRAIGQHAQVLGRIEGALDGGSTS